jgi:hypothetical protein
MRLCELAASRVRFAIGDSAQRRLASESQAGLSAVYGGRAHGAHQSAQESARRARVPPRATRPNAKWSKNFSSDKPLDERWFRVRTVIDQFMCECLEQVADRALNVSQVAWPFACRRGARYPGIDYRGQRQRIRRQSNGCVLLSVWCASGIYPPRQPRRE